MLMQKIRDKAGWVVLVAVVSFLALIFVDWGMSPGNQIGRKVTIGKVDGKKIRFEDFDELVKNQAEAATQRGQDLNSGDYASLRRTVFNHMVDQILQERVYASYHLQGTPEEILDYLRRNPPPGAKSAPIFMGPDSQFNQGIYEKWLADPRIHAQPYMQMLEAEARDRELPMYQIQKLIHAGMPVTSLEVAFQASTEKTQLWGLAIAVPADSFPPPPQVSDAQVQAYFDAHPDSFYVAKAVTHIPYAWIYKRPSRTDSLHAKEDIDTLLARARGGEIFDSLAKAYSEDPGSAAQGGHLGGYQKRTQWVPVFAEAVARLEPGQISEPVLSSFGWHLIKLNGRKIENGDTLYDASHILVSITVSPDAIDNAKDTLEAVAREVREGKKSFAEAARLHNVAIDTSDLTEGATGATRHGILPGLSAWGFLGQKDAEVSEVLENDKAVYLCGRGDIVPAGRHLENYREDIRQTVAKLAQRDQALAWAKQLPARIASCDTSTACIEQQGKVFVTVLGGRPSESFVRGFGFGGAPFYALQAQAARKPGAWTAPIALDGGAGLLRLDSIHAPSAEQLEQLGKLGLREANQRRNAIDAYQHWFDDLHTGAKIEDNLDRFYRD